jgi:hypothetical protein
MDFGILFGIVVVSGIAGMFFGGLYLRKKKEAGFPKTWFHQGDAAPPANVDIALKVIEENCPKKKLRQGGFLTWTKELPFLCDGYVLNAETPTLKMSVIEPVYKSALAHEIAHYYGFKDKTPELNAWVADVNKKIQERIAMGP